LENIIGLVPDLKTTTEKIQFMVSILEKRLQTVALLDILRQEISPKCNFSDDLYYSKVMNEEKSSIL
jgi:hypothetical protein